MSSRASVGIIVSDGDAHDPLYAILESLRFAREAHISKQLRRPFVLLTWAQSADGYIASEMSTRTPISCPETAELTQALRANSHAVLVGVETALADNPRLTVRSPAWLNQCPQPSAVILDSHLRTPGSTACIRERQELSGPKTFLYCEDEWLSAAKNTPEWMGASGTGNVVVRSVPRASPGGPSNEASSTPSGLDLGRVLRDLHQQDILSVMVEGGCRVLTSFMEQGLADFVIVTIAPRFLGHGVQAIRSDSACSRQPTFSCIENAQWVQVGSDMVLRGTLQSEVEVRSCVS